jgi:hypothetical protein
VPVPEIQRLEFDGIPNDIEDGSWTITFDGETTAPLSTNGGGAAAVQAELESLSNIGAGQVSVTDYMSGGLDWMGYDIEFAGTLANTNVPEVTVTPSGLKRKADTITLTTIQTGQSVAQEEQTIDLGGATTGTFDVDNGGTPVTVTVPTDTTAMQAAMDSVWGSGNSTVSEFAGTYYITIHLYADQPQMSISNDTTDGSVSAGTTYDGAAGQQHIVSLSLDDSPTEGVVELADVGASVVWNCYSDAATVEAEINASGLQVVAFYGGVTVSGSGTSGDPWIISSVLSCPDQNWTATEGSTPLRKAATITPSTIQDGSGGGGGGGAVPAPTHLLLLNCGG